MDLVHIQEVIKSTCPRIDFENATTLIDDAILDSLQIMQLIMTLSEEFDIEIDADDIIPENFNSMAAISEMVLRKKEN